MNTPTNGFGTAGSGTDRAAQEVDPGRPGEENGQPLAPPTQGNEPPQRPLPTRPVGTPPQPAASAPETRRDSPVGRSVDAKTSQVRRSDLPSNLPDLDKIHHTGARPAAAPSDTPRSASAAPVTGKPPAPARKVSPAAAAPAAAVTTAGLAPGGVATGGVADRTKPEPAAPLVEPPVATTTADRSPHTVSRGPVRAAMQLRRIEPWSIFKMSLVISVVLFVVWMIAVGALYLVLSQMQVWSKINDAVTTVVSEQNGAALVSSGAVFSWAAVIGVVNIVLFTALSTIGSFIYNLCADLVGGIHITLADRD